MRPIDSSHDDYYTLFLAELARQPVPVRVLDVGSRIWHAERAPSRREDMVRACPGAEYVGLDQEAGAGVDVVGDAQKLGALFPVGHFAVVLCCSALEHIARPWVFAAELAKVVRPGGVALISTHQSFPLHAYPADYFRFSREALASLFSAGAGWRVEASRYGFPAKVIPLGNAVKVLDWNFEAEAFLIVEAILTRL